MDAFTRHMQRLPTGGEQPDSRGAFEDGLRERRDGVDHMLTIVEQDDEVAGPQRLDDAGERILDQRRCGQGGGDRGGHQVGVGDRGEVDETDVLVSDRAAMGDGQRHAGLADAAGSDDRDQACGGELSLQQVDDAVAADQAGQRIRHALAEAVAGLLRPAVGRAVRGALHGIGPARARRSVGRLKRLFGHGGDEAVAAAGHVDDETLAVAIVAERPPQAGQMDPQIDVLDMGVGPGGGGQLVLGDQFAAPFSERQQDQEGAATEPDRFAVIEQQAARGD